eukprot:TRINITY_DN14672_c1_g1_i1.p1 TRINITY_DN14672_c1_g1~~TRINITY_DN14672_c1_g1_i1.p1  ORF type:complete len:1278 (+),score=300.96 TRINITY_DN14672_c1_g1_i1:101-3934(+)
MQSMQVSGTNQDNNLPYVCWNHLPPNVSEHVKKLFQNDGGVVMYFFALVHKVGRKVVPQTRVLMVSHNAIWQCMPTSEVNRCVKIEDMSEVLISHDSWLGIKVPKEYDLLLVPTSKEALKNFQHVATVLYKQLTKKDLRVTKLREDQNIKSMLNLKKPSRFEVKKQLFVLKRDVWRVHYRKQRAVAAAADEGRLGQNDASPIDMAKLVAESTENLLKTAPPGLDSPCDSPVGSPLARDSPSPCPIPTITQTEPTPKGRSQSRHFDEIGEERNPVLPPSEDSVKHPVYIIGDFLEIRRSSGWEPCVVYTIENSSYVVTTNTNEKKQVFFPEASTYLRRATFDTFGDTLKPAHHVRLFKDVEYKGDTYARGTTGVITKLLGPTGEDPEEMYIEVEIAQGKLIEVMSEEVEKEDTLENTETPPSPVPVSSAAAVADVEVHHERTVARDEPSPSPGFTPSPAPSHSPSQSRPVSQSPSLPPVRDAYQERLHAMKEHDASRSNRSPSASQPSPSPQKDSPSPRTGRVADEPSPPPPPPPPPPPQPTSVTLDAQHHSAKYHQDYHEDYTVPPTPPRQPSTSPDVSSPFEREKTSVSAMSSPGTPHSVGQSTLLSPEKVKVDLGVSQMLASGEFGKLGEFVATLCDEYRKQVEGLGNELRSKTESVKELEYQLKRTHISPKRSDETDLKVSYLEHELGKSEDLVVSLRNELSSRTAAEQHDSGVSDIDQKNDVLQLMLLEREEELSALRLRNRELERRVAEDDETISFLKARAVDQGSSSKGQPGTGSPQGLAEAHRRIEELEEQVLSLEIANEEKQTDALLLREAIVMAERRSDVDQADTHSSNPTKRVIDMTAQELQHFLGTVLCVTPETCEALKDVSGYQLLNMPPVELSRKLHDQDLSALFKALNISEEEVRRSVTPSYPSGSPQPVITGEPHISEVDEMKELSKVAWILSSRSKMVEMIWRGYEMVTNTRSQITSAHWNLMKGEVNVKEATTKIANAESNLSKVEATFKNVVTDYFMDFEKLHLGVVGHKPRGRSRSPRKESQDLKIALKMSKTERRLLAKLTTGLYRSSSVKVKGRDGVLYTAALPRSMSLSSSKRSLSPEDRRERTVSPASSVGTIQRGPFEQIMYLTPPASAIAPQPPAPQTVEIHPPQSHTSPKRRVTPNKRRGTPRASPTQARTRNHSPTVAFGRSALPRPESPQPRRRNSSNDPRVAYGTNGRKLPSGQHGHLNHITVKEKPNRREVHREQSSSMESYPESGPLSGWQTEKQARTPIFPFGRT